MRIENARESDALTSTNAGVNYRLELCLYLLLLYQGTVLLCIRDIYSSSEKEKKKTCFVGAFIYKFLNLLRKIEFEKSGKISEGNKKKDL